MRLPEDGTDDTDDTDVSKHVGMLTIYEVLFIYIFFCIRWSG
jgi:hypothetical protein